MAVPFFAEGIVQRSAWLLTGCLLVAACGGTVSSRAGSESGGSAGSSTDASAGAGGCHGAACGCPSAQVACGGVCCSGTCTGSRCLQVLAPGAAPVASAMAVDSHSVYWIDQDGVKSVGLDGGPALTLVTLHALDSRFAGAVRGSVAVGPGALCCLLNGIDLWRLGLHDRVAVPLWAAQ